MADGTVFEDRAVPAAAIITHTFIHSANAMAQRNGFPGYRYAITPHPISSLSSEEVDQRAADLLPQILALLGIEERAANTPAAAS